MERKAQPRRLQVAALLVTLMREIPAALFPLVVLTLAPLAAPSVLGLAEGTNDLLGGFARMGGVTLARQPRRRRPIMVLLPLVAGAISASLGAVNAAWQAATLRVAATAVHEIRDPSQDALIRDAGSANRPAAGGARR